MMMTKMSGWYWRICPSSPSPSIGSMRRSLSTSSMAGSLPMSLSASWPLAACTTWCPSRRKMMSSIPRSPASSSTTRIRPMRGQHEGRPAMAQVRLGGSMLKQRRPPGRAAFSFNPSDPADAQVSGPPLEADAHHDLGAVLVDAAQVVAVVRLEPEVGFEACGHPQLVEEERSHVADADVQSGDALVLVAEEEPLVLAVAEVEHFVEGDVQRGVLVELTRRDGRAQRVAARAAAGLVVVFLRVVERVVVDAAADLDARPGQQVPAIDA